MSQPNERSFGARLRKLKDGIVRIKKWDHYTPPRKEDGLTQLEAFALRLQDGNTLETANQAKYTQAVKVRQVLFGTHPGSVDKMLRLVRNAVIAQYGKKSNLLTQVTGIIRVYRATKLVKAPANPADPQKADLVSRSQKSYGSRTQYFADIVTTIAQFADYTSSNPQLTIDGLNQKVIALNLVSDDVAAALKDISTVRNSRSADYDELDEKISRIKAYALSEYGADSAEYKDIMSLGF